MSSSSKSSASLFQSIRERKRVRNEVNASMTMLSSLSLEDMERCFSSPDVKESHIIALLVLRFGVLSLLLARYVIKKIPALLPKETKGVILHAIFPSISRKEIDFLITHVQRVPEFTNESLCEEKVENACSTSGIPFREVLSPPVDYCMKCGGNLTMHNKPVNVTIFKVGGPVQAIKLSFKCLNCGVVYKYAQHGTKSQGYEFYPERRPVVEATNVAYVERLLCEYQVSLSNHAWVSYIGFTEAYNDATEGCKQDPEILDRRITSNAFMSHELEEECRERNLTWLFKGEKEQSYNDLIAHIEKLRSSELYEHKKEDCSELCRKRGCEFFVSMDGVWKLRFPHCMFPVKAEIAGFRALNYPNVCTKEPASQNSAFCSYHCDIAKKENIPTNLREFIHDYCGVARSTSSKENEDQVSTDQVSDSAYEVIDRKLEDILDTTQILSDTGNTAEAQGTKEFLAANAGLLAMPMGTSEPTGETDACNKETGRKKATLQKWSRGLHHFVRGGGIIEKFDPLFISESPSQVFYLTLHYLYLRLKGVPEAEWKNFVLSYDNMCNVDRLLAARSPVPLPKPFDEMWLKIKKVIDRLHLRNHKNPLCAEKYSAEPLKDAYPSLNTMVAEQTFSWASRYKKVLCAMPQRRFLFFYHRMVVRRNKYICKCYKANRDPVLPKVTSEYST